MSNNKTIRVALAGAGAFGTKHLDGIKNIDGVEVVSVIGRELDKTKEVAQKSGIGHVGTDLAESLAMAEVDAVILCTPTQMHAEQSIACLKAGLVIWFFMHLGEHPTTSRMYLLTTLVLLTLLIGMVVADVATRLPTATPSFPSLKETRGPWSVCACTPAPLGDQKGVGGSSSNR